MRGVVTQTTNYSVQYAAYFSAFSSVYQLEAARTTGFDASVYFPKQRLEVGTSYQRFLQQRHINSEAVYVSWQPPQVPLDVKAEYDHSYYGYGYWIQGAYMLSQVPVANSFFKRMELAGRLQQSFPLNGGGNGVSSVNTKRPGVALNYYIKDNLRLVSSYERQFTSSKDANLWNIGFTYRFVWPLWPGRE